MSQITHTASILLNIQQEGNAPKAVQDLAAAYANMQPLAAQGTAALSRGLHEVAELCRFASGGMEDAATQSRQLMSLAQQQSQQREALYEQERRRLQGANALPVVQQRAMAQEMIANRQQLALQQQHDIQRMQFQQAQEQAQQPLVQRNAPSSSSTPAYYQGYGKAGQAIGNAPAKLLEGAIGAEGAKLAGAFAAVAMAAIKATDALGEMARIGNISQNPFKTNAQKGREIAEGLPVVGAAAKNWNAFQDMLNGTQKRIALAEYKYNVGQLRQRQQLELGELAGSHFAESASSRNRAAAFARLGRETVAPPSIDRSSFQGEIAYREQQQRLPAQDAVRRADAEARAARADLRSSEGRLHSLQSRQAALRSQAEHAHGRGRSAIGRENRFGVAENALGFGNRDAAGRAETGYASLAAQQELLNNQKLIEQEIARQKQLGLSVATHESALRKANVEVARTELDILRQKEQRLTNQAQRFGTMGLAQQYQGLHAARIIKQYGGTEGLPPELVQRAAASYPEYVAKMAEISGPKSDVYKTSVAEGFLEKGSLAKTREDFAKAQTNFKVELIFNEEALARRISQVFTETFERLLREVRVKHQAEFDKMKTGFILKNSGAGH